MMLDDVLRGGKGILVVGLLAMALTGCPGNGGGGRGEAPPRGDAPPAVVLPHILAAQDSIVPNAIPYTLELVPADSTGLPALQSYSAAPIADNRWLLVGGRLGQGLHTFAAAPAQNFPDTLTNYYMWVIDPTVPRATSLDLRLLPPEIGVPLMSSNQNHYYDATDSILYVSGGYGWKADASDMQTFSTFTRIPAARVADVITSGLSAQQKADSVAALLEVMEDDLFRVTGGELLKLDGWYYLVFGQIFDGQYCPFSTCDFDQTYTETIKIFQMFPDSFGILSRTQDTRQGAPGAPFHRRDLSVVDDIDPVTGNLRITALGGVFPPGFLGGFTQPVYIAAPNDIRIETDTVNGAQRFSQYTSPVVVVHDPAARAVHRTHVGGIGHYYFWQTPAQDSVRRIAAQQMRDDGLPWLADITTYSEYAEAQAGGSRFTQYIATAPVPDTILIGATVEFIPNPGNVASGLAYENGVIRLDRLTARTQVGWVYGGIQSLNPLPIRPNTGTWATSKLWRVFLSPTPAPGIPARLARQAAHSPVPVDSIHERRGGN